jgi:reactive intermediate/imine deaminase
MRLVLTVLMLCCGASVVAAPVFYDEGPMAGQGLPFSESVRVGDLLLISGQLGVDNKNQLVPGGIQAEAHQTLNNISGALKRRGLGFEDVVKCTVFLADVSEWGAFNAIYAGYFEKPYPARSALGANGLALGASLELECIAAYPDSETGD